MARGENIKNARERLLLASGLYIIFALIGTWLAVQERLPAEFMGILKSQDPARDFPLLGTALSAPLLLLIVQLALMIALVHRIKEWECTLGLILLAGIYILGQLGEPVLWEAFAPVVRPQIAVLLIANLLCPLGMIVFGLQNKDRILSTQSL
jgi:hypothetical protein